MNIQRGDDVTTDLVKQVWVEADPCEGLSSLAEVYFDSWLESERRKAIEAFLDCKCGNCFICRAY